MVELVAFRVYEQPCFRIGSVGRKVRVTAKALWLVRSHSCHPEDGLKSGDFVDIVFKGTRPIVGLSGLRALVSAVSRRVRVDMREW